MSSLRILTGVTGVDEILNGGLIPASSYLIIGSPGSGKTIFSLHFLRKCRDNGGRCLYLSLAESVDSVRKNAKGFGWKLNDINLVDLTLSGKPNTNGEYSIFSPGEVEAEDIWKNLYESIEKHKPNGIVIDSMTTLKYLSTSEYLYRKNIQNLIINLSKSDCLSYLIFESSELEKDKSIATIVDGILRFRRQISKEKLIEIRSIEIEKFRGSGYLSGRHSLSICSSGIKVFPRKIEKIKQPAHEDKKVNSGIPLLDQITKGGFQAGTCTMLTGSSGVGKSTLVTQFLCHNASLGERVVMYCFEEGKQSVLDRCSGVNIPLKRQVEDGRVILREINPLSMSPDEFLKIIRNDVEKARCKILALDSLRSYELAMAEYGNVVANVQNILNYTRGKGVSLFLVNEMQGLLGQISLSEEGVSYLTDNVLLLRYAEYNGEIIKVIACLKKRHGDFESDLREIKISEQGILIGEKLTRMRGVLSGIPKTEDLGRKPEL